MIPLSNKQPSQDQIRTCSSLTEAENLRSKAELYKHNFATLSESKLAQAQSESLLQIDHCTESLLLKLPANIRAMRVADFIERYESELARGEFRFEMPASTTRRAKIEDRGSGESLRKKVRQQLAETRTSQTLLIPGTRPFLEKPASERQQLIDILNAVVSTYNQAHRDADN